jgi:IS5 family transposase
MQCSYEQLAFHLVDSLSFRRFCRLPYGAAPARSTLQENICRIRASTWQAINQQLVSWAQKKGLEKGRKVRIDATVVESDIHYPLDSQLLYDSVRVTTRVLERIAEREKIHFHNHCRRAKRRCTNIRNSRGQKRKKSYADLIRVTRQTRSYIERVISQSQPKRDPITQAWVDQLQHWAPLVDQVIEQSYRRVILGEAVPVDEKIVSIFEEHTDILRKGGRDTLFGHKIFLTCGKSSLMLDCLLTRGNPADQSLACRMLRRQQKLFDRYPRQASFDGGFATPDNLNWAKKQGVQDVVFAKKAGLKIENMARSSWVYRQLRRFRAGIEGCISTLKRVFGLRRCSWKGWDHFQQYVQLSVVSYNLIVLARLLLR